MHCAGRDPERAVGGRDPAGRLGVHGHDAAAGVDDLVLVVPMRGDRGGGSQIAARGRGRRQVARIRHTSAEYRNRERAWRHDDRGVNHSKWRMTVLVAGHAVDDLYQGAVPAIVPFLVAERSYGYVAAAGITVAATLLSSVVQPLFGVLTDRRAMPWLVPVGMTVAGVGIGLCGLGDSYLFTWLAIALS